jgi:hypothetical protein
VVPDGQERLHEPLTDLVGLGGEHGRQLLDRVDRQPHGGHEQVLLGPEVVVDQGRVDPGQLGHPPDGGPLVALLGERPPGRAQDRLPGPARPGPPAGPRHPPSWNSSTVNSSTVEILPENGYGRPLSTKLARSS